MQSHFFIEGGVNEEGVVWWYGVKAPQVALRSEWGPHLLLAMRRGKHEAFTQRKLEGWVG